MRALRERRACDRSRERGAVGWAVCGRGQIGAAEREVAGAGWRVGKSGAWWRLKGLSPSPLRRRQAFSAAIDMELDSRATAAAASGPTPHPGLYTKPRLGGGEDTGGAGRRRRANARLPVPVESRGKEGEDLDAVVG
jgi:hypothetical protein